MLNRLSSGLAAITATARPRAGLRGAALACLGALVLAGCAQPWQRFQPGEDQSTIISHLGAPRETYDLPNGGKRLMWPTQPMGETTTAADIDASGKIVNVRQVLQPNEFYRAEIGKWTREDVLVNFGRPVETSYFPLMKREVWTYRYQEDNVWYLMYSFYFDNQGILRLTQKTPDPLHDPDRRSNFF
ncbi:hypothetical protein [Paraburkholderia sp. BL10I2N1]|uniref:hypothetical protein n=1 Tax=Paraburkholderia sp. BL10I2N1 TaxID=1938796 RepID=UPI0010612400|nr:hypothetical protein [Paraburkholderia sp. BL10I2N1]TDN70933.1 hypothetical protein B0G77_4451 [Paraburkholderia sp. BL10I2N1]